MVIDKDRKYREIAVRGKYQRLYEHLCGLSAEEWRTSFREIEGIIGFELPSSARLYRPWWANQNGSGGHSQAIAWGAAGWETAQVDMDAETLLLRRKRNEDAPKRSLDEIWPSISVGEWPEDLSLRREDMYDYRVRI